MTSENWERLQIEMIVTEREAMISENKQREIEGKSLTYTEKDFINLINKLWEIGHKL